MTKVWLELKYGNPDKGGALLCNIQDKALLRQAKTKILRDAEMRARISELTDEVLGVLDRGDYEKLKRLLDLLIPDKGEVNYVKD